MINEKKNFDCELVEWPLICRDLYQHRRKGGADANTDRLKQSISAVRASGGFPGNVYKPCKAYVYCWENNYLPRLKNYLPSRARNHKSLCALGQALDAPGKP